jgi:hypothetical protein
MATPNYKEIENLLDTLTPFKHGKSMRAEITVDTETQAVIYTVYSYKTIIAEYNSLDDAWWVNPNKYSVTTSKQQNIVRRVAQRTPVS